MRKGKRGETERNGKIKKKKETEETKKNDQKTGKEKKQNYKQ